MSDNVNNGRRVQLEAGDYSGLCGLLEKDGVETIAYIPNKSGARPQPNREVTVDGVQRTIQSIGRSDLIQKMVIIRLQPVSEA